MNDQELRALVRESIAKQLGGRGGNSGPAERHERSPLADPAFPQRGAHPSHAVYLIPRDGDDSPCIIEPSVPCTHCNYCKSHGH